MGVCSDERRTILLLSSLVGEDLRLTLLHEMCHIGIGGGYSHGPRFLKKMRRIARLGEPKLLEDIERYDGTSDARRVAALRAQGQPVHEISFRQRIESDLDALSDEHYARSWPTIRRVLAEQNRLAPSEIDRFAPWAKREWRRLGAEGRSLAAADKAFKEGRLPAGAKKLLRSLK